MIDVYLIRRVTIVRAPASDRWGQPTASPQRVQVMAHFRPSNKVFTGSAGEEVQATGLFTFGAGTELSFTDRIEVDGKEYRPLEIRRPWTLDGEALVRVYVA